MAFGYSFHIDCYGIDAEKCDSLEISYRFLEDLVDLLDMNKFTLPLIFHGPRIKGQEQYPEKSGITGFIGLIESGISIHTISPKEFATIDIYSCRQFDPKIVKDFIQKTYNPKTTEESFLERGTKYHG